MVIEFLNCMFFVCVIVPKIVKTLASTWKFFTLLDYVYSRFWDKIQFCVGIVSFMIKQWINNSVKKIGTNTYELTFVIQGDISKIIVTKNYPEIVDIQNQETEESYMNELEPYVRYNAKKCEVPAPAIIYYENGKSELWRSSQ